MVVSVVGRASTNAMGDARPVMTRVRHSGADFETGRLGHRNDEQARWDSDSDSDESEDEEDLKV